MFKIFLLFFLMITASCSSLKVKEEKATAELKIAAIVCSLDGLPYVDKDVTLVEVKEGYYKIKGANGIWLVPVSTCILEQDTGRVPSEDEEEDSDEDFNPGFPMKPSSVIKSNDNPIPFKNESTKVEIKEGITSEVKKMEK